MIWYFCPALVVFLGIWLSDDDPFLGLIKGVPGAVLWPIVLAVSLFRFLKDEYPALAKGSLGFRLPWIVATAVLLFGSWAANQFRQDWNKFELGVTLEANARQRDEELRVKQVIAARKANLEDLGLLGERPVKRSAPQVGLSGGLKGNFESSFFFGSGGSSGNIEGHLQSQPILTFYWEQGSGIETGTSLPLKFFQIITDEKRVQPTVEFIFDQAWLNSGVAEDAKPRPDLVLENGHLAMVKVRISQATKEKEIYLPH